MDSKLLWLMAYPGLPFLAGTVAILGFYAADRSRPRGRDILILPLLNAAIAFVTQFATLLPLVLLDAESRAALFVAVLGACVVQYLVTAAVMPRLSR